nr:hypothetical protein BaRGS_017725 [Batillaria attramentaria]
MMRSLSVVLVMLSLALVARGADQTARMELLQHWDDNWEGRFCFHLPAQIVGFEIKISFSVGVKQMQV